MAGRLNRSKSQSFIRYIYVPGTGVDIMEGGLRTIEAICCSNAFAPEGYFASPNSMRLFPLMVSKIPKLMLGGIGPA